MDYRLAVLLWAGLWLGCTPQPKDVRDPVERARKEQAQSPQRQQAEKRRPQPDPCQSFAMPQTQTPVYLDVGEGGFVVTRVLKSCVTRNGAPGFERGSPWMAMGIPCTAGPGGITISGRSYAPKMISFNISTDCPMNPGNPSIVDQTAKARLGLASTNQLLAYNPLSVQYWEVEGYPDAGIGDALELRSLQSIRTGWLDFKDRNKPLVVQLYGRENAWVQDAVMFHITAELTFIRPRNFKLNVVNVRALSKEDENAAAKNCLARGLRNKCATVFD